MSSTIKTYRVKVVFAWVVVGFVGVMLAGREWVGTAALVPGNYGNC